MTRACSLFAVCLALAGSVLVAQDKPNFVGTWKLPADAQPEPFIPPQMVVALDGKTMTVVATGQMGEFKTTYNMDGTEAKSPIQFNGDTIDRTTKAAWDGNKLVMTVIANFNGQSFETKTVWSLGADGALQVELTRPDFQGGGGPITSKLTYKKG
jgi:hypothetical protein